MLAYQTKPVCAKCIPRLTVCPHFATLLALFLQHKVASKKLLSLRALVYNRGKGPFTSWDTSGFRTGAASIVKDWFSSHLTSAKSMCLSERLMLGSNPPVLSKHPVQIFVQSSQFSCPFYASDFAYWTKREIPVICFYLFAAVLEQNSTSGAILRCVRQSNPRVTW